MKSNSVRKLAVSINAFGVLSLNSFNDSKVEVLDVNPNMLEVVGINRVNLCKDNFSTINTKKMATLYDTMAYNKNGREICKIPRNTIVEVVSTNGEYTEVILEDKRDVFLKTNTLYNVANVNSREYFDVREDNEMTINNTDYLYDENGLIIDCVYNKEKCIVSRSNIEYSYITLEDGRSGYVKSYILSLDYIKINAYAYAKSKINTYSDSDLTNISSSLNVNQLVFVKRTNNDSALIVCDGNETYTRLSDLVLTNDTLYNIA